MDEERDIIRSLFLQIKEDERYKEYLNNGESSWEDDKRFYRRLYDGGALKIFTKFMRTKIYIGLTIWMPHR